MPDKHWKRAERMIAKDCGGRRIPVTGERDGSDVDHPLFSFQVKVRRSLPGWLFSWLAGIVASAKAKDRIGVLVLNLPRKPRRGALVVLRWDDWVSLHGALEIGSRTLEREQQIADILGDGSWLEKRGGEEGGGQ